SPQQPPNRRRCRRRQTGPVGFAFENASNGVGYRFTGERALAGEHFVHHTAEGPDVRALVDGAPARLLRAHISRGAEDDTVAGAADGDRGRLRDVRAPSLAAGFGEPEVQHLYHAVRRDLDVRGFEISMNDAFLVC